MTLFISILITFLCMPWPAMIMMSPMMVAAPNFADKKSNIVTAILFFIYPSFIFLLAKLLGFNFYGTNPIYWAAATFAVGFLVSILYKLHKQLFNVFNGIANYGYFFKDDCVFLDGNKINGADAITFTHFNNRGHYSKDQNHVYYNEKKLKCSDAATFQPLANDDTDGYWHDKYHGYYKWNKITDADGATLKYAGHHFAFDKEHVFCEGKLIHGANRKTFSPIASFIGRDSKNVYVRTMSATNIRDIESFEIITINDELFGKDSKQIYNISYGNNPLTPFPNADLETFEPVGSYYAKDKNQVYYYSYHIDQILVLEGAIPATFVLHYDAARNTDATDGIRYYKSGVLHVE